MKKYLLCTITTNNGQIVKNELMLSEARLISQMAQENKFIHVQLVETSVKYYNIIFGK